jgi:DnaJ-class molecular chaperone
MKMIILKLTTSCNRADGNPKCTQRSPVVKFQGNQAGDLKVSNHVRVPEELKKQQEVSRKTFLRVDPPSQNTSPVCHLIE